ncbi:MAG: preprotein translocase subunit SecE [Frankiales bacterium]|nr:preprotein translocase subunit SecE [Frankiales bacterium]
MTETSSGARPVARPAGSKRPVKRANVFARINLFIRQVIAELRKVIWPGRNDLITYTLTVIVFVAVIVAIVTALDLSFAKLVLLVFGK